MLPKVLLGRSTTSLGRLIEQLKMLTRQALVAVSLKLLHVVYGPWLSASTGSYTQGRERFDYQPN